MDEAAAHTRKSAEQAERDAERAQESCSAWLSVARRLQELREENGFSQLFDDALGGSHG